MTDRIARWLFTPATQAAQTHLQREGVPTQKIIPVGDVMYDVALHHGARTNATSGNGRRLGLIPWQLRAQLQHRAEH